MLDKPEDLMVVTFSDNVLGTQKMPHVPCTFSVPQGQKDIAAQVIIEKTKHPSAKLIVVLDYYWLQLGYYERYGLCEWFKTGFRRVLKAGADWVLFPNDAGTLNSEQKQGAQGKRMSAALAAGILHENVVWKYITKDENPLWVASADVAIGDELSLSPGGDNELCTKQYLHPKNAFVEFSLAAQSNVVSLSPLLSISISFPVNIC